MMMKNQKMASVTGFLLVVMVALFNVAAADTYTVGDDLGWALPPAGNIAYSTWARTKSFDLGDVIVFRWSGSNHDVAEVSKADYDSCNTTKPINGTIYRISPVNITLNTNNTRYFICTVPDHCKTGQKVTISMEQKWWDDGNSASSLRKIGAFFAFFLTTFVTFFLNY